MTAIRNSGRRHRNAVTLALLTLAAIGAVIFVAGSAANLPGSSFEGNDGNLVVNGGAGAHDWDNAPNLSAGQDIQNAQQDNSFGQGTKESNVAVTVVTGSIPNNKANLARFAVAGETVGSNSYLYLAWSRENQSGTVNFDFEINAAPQPDLTTPGPKTLVRTTGDLRITYDFQGGSNTPALGLRTWTGSAWTGSTPLAGCAEGLTNASTVSENLGGFAPVDRPAQQFGEAAIDLTCAGVVPPGSCEPFSSAYVKSRASTSFNSEIKDFIAPVSLAFNNCGTITIIKHTNPGGLDQAFGYTTTGGLDPATFSLNDAGVDTRVYSSVPPGSYTVSEDADPVGFQFASLNCVGGGANTTTSGRVATIGLEGGENVVCTYINDQQLGAIRVVKTRKHAADGPGPHPHAGVSFTIAGESVVTDANGVACVDGLPFGTYDATETLPAGYHADQALTQSATVDNNTSCNSDPYGGETLNFGNTPLTDVTVSIDSQVAGGTATNVDCDNDALDFDTDATSGDGSATASDQEPQVIHCTITVDP